MPASTNPLVDTMSASLSSDALMPYPRLLRATLARGWRRKAVRASTVFRFSRPTAPLALDPRPRAPSGREAETERAQDDQDRNCRVSSLPPGAGGEHRRRGHVNSVFSIARLTRMGSEPLGLEIGWYFCDRCGCSVDTEVLAEDGRNFTPDGDFLCSSCLYPEPD